MPPSDAAARQPWPLFGRYCLLDTPEARLRLAATTTMASTLAHEVNQPLTAAVSALYAAAGRLRTRGEGHEDLLAMIEHASAEALRAGEIVRRLRAFVVTGKVAARRENLRTMVERVTAALGWQEEVTVEIVTEVPLGLFVLAERVQIEQVLSNLVVNACEALAGRPGARVTIGAARVGAEVVLSVADNGPGLAPDVLARAFEPMFSTKPGATGLGLAICRTIVEAHGGRIWAEAGGGGGAVFRVALPAAERPGG